MPPYNRHGIHHEMCCGRIQSAGCVWWARDATDAYKRIRPLQRGSAGVLRVEVALRRCALGDAIVQPLADELIVHACT